MTHPWLVSASLEEGLCWIFWVQIVEFLNDFSNASSRAQQLDQNVLRDAAPVSGLYGDLLSIAIAQVYGSTQLTIGTAANGNFNGSDVMMFMRNVGGMTPKLVNPISFICLIGDWVFLFSRVNAVETLYSAFPAFMYLDPTLGAPLLEPLFRLQASSRYPVQFAAADLGASHKDIKTQILRLYIL
jgi:Domain of unknown function (DUF4965)